MLDKKWLNQQIKEMKKNCLDEQMETNNKNKEIYHSKDKNVSKQYETKMLMFKSFGLSYESYYEIERYASKILEYKREVSRIISENIIDIDTKLISIKIDRNNLKNCDVIGLQIVNLDQKYLSIIGSKNMQLAYTDVVANYKTCIKQRLRNCQVKNINSTYQNRGVIKYLVRFYSPTLKSYLLNKNDLFYEQAEALKLLLYDEAKVAKFIKGIRSRIFYKTKINYKSLSFTNCGAISSYGSLIRSNPYNNNKKLRKTAKGKFKRFLRSNMIFNFAFMRLDNIYELPIRINLTF